VNKPELLAYLSRLDQALQQPTTLYIYGSAALILLDEPGRTSADVDVAAPYSQANFADLQRAATAAGLPVNPDESYRGDHIEWIGALRLCLPKPVPTTEVVLWQGERLTIKTVPVPQLIASKLIRYDAIDRADIQYLCSQTKVDVAAITAAVRLLPVPFDGDAIVLENLRNLEADLKLWRGEEP
jgi:hypothetical protein